MWFDCFVRRVRRWWCNLFTPPKPSPFFVLFEDQHNFFLEYGMAHTKKMTIALPALREDEQAFKDEHDAGIASRHLLITVNGSLLVDTQVALDVPQFVQGGIPAGSTVDIDLSNVLTDGHEGLPTTRSVLAPAEPKPIPSPDSFEVTFEDEPHVHE
jgi:hypothetical protein